MDQKIVIIAYNRTSGSFDQRQLDKLCAAFSAAGSLCQPVDSYGDDLLVLVPKAAHICVVGGDGTLRDMVARLRDLRHLPPISIFPAGTINLVARELSYPRNIEKFVARVLHGAAPRRLYLGLLNQRQAMLVCASIGPESYAVAGLSEKLKARIGRFAYLAALGKLLYNWPRPVLSVQADGLTYKCEAAYLLNGRYFAGPWRVSRAADMLVPVFQLLLLPRARRRDYLRLMLSVAIIPALASKTWLRLAVSSLEITANAALPVQVDGDITAVLPMNATVDKRAVMFA